MDDELPVDGGEGDGGVIPAVVVSPAPETDPAEADKAQAVADKALDTALDAQDRAQDFIDRQRDENAARMADHHMEMQDCMSTTRELKEWQPEIERRVQGLSDSLEEAREETRETNRRLGELLETLTIQENTTPLPDTETPSLPVMPGAETETVTEEEITPEKSAGESQEAKQEAAEQKRRRIIRLR